MKFSAAFNRDFDFYLKHRHRFNFDGCPVYFNKRGKEVIQHDPKGVSGKVAFWAWDTSGKIIPTKHPNLLLSLLKAKGSCNLHIKMYAEDRASGLMSGLEFRALCIYVLSPPQWFKDAIHRMKCKIQAEMFKTNESCPI